MPRKSKQRIEAEAANYSILEDIMKKVNDIDPSKIGVFRDKGFKSLAWGKADKIRTNNPVEKISKTLHSDEAFDMSNLTEAVLKLYTEKETYKSFTQLSNIYEYIIFIHRKYEVNIHPALSDKKNRTLATAMASNARKFEKQYSEHFAHNILTRIQFTTIM